MFRLRRAMMAEQLPQRPLDSQASLWSFAWLVLRMMTP